MRPNIICAASDMLCPSFFNYSNHIGAIRNYNCFRVGFEQFIHGFLYIFDLNGASILQVIIRNTRRIDVDLPGMVQGLIDVLGAPLFNDNIFRITVALPLVLPRSLIRFFQVLMIYRYPIMDQQAIHKIVIELRGFAPIGMLE